MITINHSNPTVNFVNGFVKCSEKSVEILYIAFLHAGMTSFGIYLDDNNPEHLFFQWYIRTKMKCISQSLLKEVNGQHKYLRRPYLQDNEFEVLRKSISWDKIYVVCA